MGLLTTNKPEIDVRGSKYSAFQHHLQGEQEREIVRVVVDCCLSEKEYNPFYAFLVVKLCQHSKVCACGVRTNGKRKCLLASPTVREAS